MPPTQRINLNAFHTWHVYPHSSATHELSLAVAKELPMRPYLLPRLLRSAHDSSTHSACLPWQGCVFACHADLNEALFLFTCRETNLDLGCRLLRLLPLLRQGLQHCYRLYQSCTTWYCCLIMQRALTVVSPQLFLVCGIAAHGVDHDNVGVRVAVSKKLPSDGS